MTSLYPKKLITLIEQLKKLPGVGKKTAERFAFKILEWSTKDQQHLAETLSTLHLTVLKCDECGAFKEETSCPLCQSSFRSKTLCIVASPKDVYAIEQTRIYHGHYHVLGGLLSPLQGKTPEFLPLKSIEMRLERLAIEEIILALDSTLEGDTTSLYLHEYFKQKGIKVTKLAMGLPVGSSLDFIDEGTLSKAFSGRLLLH